MKIAIISGASSGIGKCFAKSMDSLGLDEIWLIARNQDRLLSLQGEMRTRTRCIAVDLGDRASFDAISSLLKENIYSIEYLILSAGVGYNGAFEGLSLDEIKGMIDINCSALTMLACISIPYVANGGKIINIASGAGFLPQPNFAVYSASKAYVISFSRSLRHELKGRGIKVTAVCPGPVDTNFFAGLDNVKEYKKKYLISPQRVSEGALRAVCKNKAVYTPTLSMKLVHLASKIIPTSLILKFYK